MKFRWDEAKRKANLVQHGFDFADAELVFSGTTFTFEDDRFDYGEQRFISIGMLYGTVVVIAHTESNHVIRVISMRKATRNEQKIYFKGFTN
ncbi:MAG: BrnT family toxin [bacterium]